LNNIEKARNTVSEFLRTLWSHH